MFRIATHRGKICLISLPGIPSLSNLRHQTLPPTLPFVVRRSLFLECQFHTIIIKAMVDNRHSLSPLVLHMIEWAEGNSLVMLLAVYFETAGATWANSVVLKVQADSTDTLDAVG